MGRPSKLNETEIEGIARRVAKGESIAELARELGMTREWLSRLVSSRVKKMQTVVNAMVELPIASRHLVTVLADITAERRQNAESMGNDGLAIGAHLNTAEFAVFTEKVEVFAATELGITLVEDIEPAGRMVA